MTTILDIRQTLHQRLDNLSDFQVEKVWQFVKDLSTPMSESQESNINEFDNEIAPLSKFIGAVSHGSLAQNIAQELYE